MKIVVCGGVSWDTVIHVESFAFTKEQTVFPRSTVSTAGGTGLGKAAPLALLGFEVTLICHMGEDEERKRTYQDTLDYPIHWLVETDPLGTTTHVNLMNPFGERVSIFTNLGSFDLPFQRTEEIKTILQSADLIVLNIINPMRQWVPFIQSLHKPVFVDLHDYQDSNPYYDDFIKVATHLQWSQNPGCTDDAFINKYRHQKTMLIRTSGKAGIDLYTSLEHLHQEAIPPQVFVDTNGAGDHVSAGIIAGLLLNHPLEKILLQAAKFAAACIESPKITPLNYFKMR